MAYTEILTDRAGLRNQLDPATQQAMRQGAVDATSQFGRGWASAGLQEEVGFLADRANNAYRNGDTTLAKALELQMRDKAAQAQQWAPTVQNFTDINSAGSAIDWATGSLGQGLRSTLLPAAGSLAGAGIGALTGIVTKNPSLGAKVGAGVGGFLGGYNMEANETIASAMMDPAIRANASMQEIKDTGRAKGAVAGALEAVVPAMMVGKAAGLAGRVGKGQRLANIGKSAGQGAITEFGTETAQDVTGQVAENSLQREALSNIDPVQAFNAGMAGAVAGGGMGAMGGVAQNVTSALGSGADKVNAVRKDPVGAIADGITDLGAKAGTALAKGEAALKSKFENHFNEEAAQLGRLLSPDADNESVGKDAALQHAQRVLLREDSSEESKKRAAELVSGQRGWQSYRDSVTTEAIETRRSRMDDDLANEIAQRTGEGKQSRMSPTLTDDFGEQEGRDSTGDSVDDGFGNKVMGGADWVTPPPRPSQSSAPNDKLAKKTRAEVVASAKQAVSAYDTIDKARAAEIGQPVQPNQAGVKAKRQEEIVGLADIWRKQGVDEKLIKAGGALDTSDRQSAIATMGWVARGFTDVDGNLFVPESFTRKYKGDSVKRIVDATKLAVDQGLIDADTANKQLSVVSDMAKKQWADQTNVFDTVFDAVSKKPLGRKWSRSEVEDFIPELRRMAQNGTTKREEEFLDQLFGSKENIAKAMSAFKEPKGQSLLVDERAEKKPMSSDDAGDTEADARFESLLSIDEPKTRAKFQGRKQRGQMFATKYDEQKKELTETINVLNAGGGIHARAIGVIDALKEQFGADHKGMREAEDKMLWNAVKRNGSTEAQKAEYMAQIAALSPEQRAQQLNELNKTHKMIRVEHMDTGDVGDTIRPDQVENFRESDEDIRVVDEKTGKKTDERAANPYVKPSDGMIYLERKVPSPNGEIDKETGEIVSGMEEFKTSTFKLLKHVWAAEERERDGRTNGFAGQGVKGEYESVLRSLSALLNSDDNFTGRVGMKAFPGAKVRWLESLDHLPKTLKLKSGTVKDALNRMRSERQYGEPMGFKLAQVSAVPLMRRELKRLTAYKETPRWLQDEINELLSVHAKNPREKREALQALYERLYAQWNKAEPEMGFVGESLTDNASHSIRDNDLGRGKEVHRNDDGSLKTPAGMASVEGNSRGGRTTSVREVVGNKEQKKQVRRIKLKLKAEERSGVESTSQADTKHDPAAGAKALEEAKQWLVDLISKKNAVKVGDTLKQLDEKQEALMKKAIAQLKKTLSAMTPKQIEEEFYGVTDGAKIARIIKGLAERNPNVLLEDTTGEAGAGGQSDALGRSANTRGDAASDKSGGVPTAELGAEEGIEEVQDNKRTGRPPKAPKVKSVLSEIKSLGGLDPLHALDLTGEKAVQANRRFPGLFKKGGMSADALREALHERGWINDSIEEARELIGAMYAGETVVHADDIDAVMSHGEKLKAWEQGYLFSTIQPTDKAATKEEKAAAKQELLDTLGDTVKVQFKKDLGGISGEWKPGFTENLIQIALNSDVLGTARHESIHEFFNLLKKNGDEKIRDVLQRVATNKLVMNQLERLLSKHPAALEQIKADPEEAVAFMYQFWRAGKLKVGPQAQTFFEKVKSFLSKTYDNIRGIVRDERHAEMIMAGFAKGAFKEADKRAEVVKALNELISKEQDVAEKAGKFANKFSKALQLVYTAEGMIDLTKNEHLIKLAEMFNQRAGASMVKGDGWEGTYFDGKNRVNAKFQNQLENILDGMEKEDVELVREALATGVTPKIDRIEKAVAEMKKLNDDMMDYIDNRNISRLNEDGQWEKMQRRKDFGMPQIWDVDIIAKDTEAFKADLIKHHMKELEAIAKQANAEIAAMQKSNGQYKDLGPAAKAATDKGIDDALARGKNGIGAKVVIDTVTPEMVADAIVTRVLMSNGKVDIEESTSELGITPLAASVNRRALNWINPQAFDKYKQKDLLNIYSSYIAGMTKRGEYTIRFGHGGEVIRDQTDMAMLQEMGGDDLVRMAKAAHPRNVKAWAKAKAEAQKAGIEFNEPYPTLRMVGNDLHKIRVGEEQFKADMVKAATELERAVKAIQAMEGTLGMDVSPAVRDLNSWLMTYQNVRLLPFSLFTSLSDVVGLTLNGGTLNDAWDAFVRGMREVKVGVINDSKSMDAAAKRAEAWGTVDAMTLNDTIGQGYGSMFMSGAARNISNKFFKKIGMESWNRAMRISASVVAERMISDWAVNGIDTKDSSAKARLERLYGEGADTKQIALDPDGHLDISDPANQAAVMRFVNDAVLRPNAAMRPLWGSNPAYAAFFHLKSFTYAMHKTWLEAALNEARLGNYRPAMVLLSVYLPVGIAAGAAKEMLIPGDEPPWMKGGLDSYLSYGASKAGLLGVPQMVVSTWDTAFTDMAGPSVSQVRQALFQNPIKTGVAALPGGGTLQRYVE